MIIRFKDKIINNIELEYLMKHEDVYVVNTTRQKNKKYPKATRLEVELFAGTKFFVYLIV
jgi:hypothetical protein